MWTDSEILDNATDTYKRIISQHVIDLQMYDAMAKELEEFQEFEKEFMALFENEQKLESNLKDKILGIGDYYENIRMKIWDNGCKMIEIDTIENPERATTRSREIRSDESMRQKFILDKLVMQVNSVTKEFQEFDIWDTVGEIVRNLDEQMQEIKSQLFAHLDNTKNKMPCQYDQYVTQYKQLLCECEKMISDYKSKTISQFVFDIYGTLINQHIQELKEYNDLLDECKEFQDIEKEFIDLFKSKSRDQGQDQVQDQDQYQGQDQSQCQDQDKHKNEPKSQEEHRAMALRTFYENNQTKMWKNNEKMIEIDKTKNPRRATERHQKMVWDESVRQKHIFDGLMVRYDQIVRKNMKSKNGKLTELIEHAKTKRLELLSHHKANNKNPSEYNQHVTELKCILIQCEKITH